MAHVSHRPTPARRMYVEPRRVPAFDSDYGPYCEDDRDPRYDGPNVCPECMGTKYGPGGDLCEFCRGTGCYYGDGE